MEINDRDQNRECGAYQVGWGWRCRAVVRKRVPNLTRTPPSTPSVVSGHGMKRDYEEALCEPVQCFSPITVQTLHNTQEDRSYHLWVLDAGTEAAAFMVDACFRLDYPEQALWPGFPASIKETLPREINQEVEEAGQERGRNQRRAWFQTKSCRQ